MSSVVYPKFSVSLVKFLDLLGRSIEWAANPMGSRCHSAKLHKAVLHRFPASVPRR